MKDDSMVAALEHLTCKLHELVVQKQTEFDWMKAHIQLATKHDLEQMEKRIMATQAELAKQVTDLTTQVTKIGAETRSLLTKVDELLAVIAAGGDATPELTAAVDALKAQVQVVDDLVPDAPPPTP